jgi:tRNA 2-selenouridine synthase
MPIQSISVESFLQLSNELPILDVRSPQEYAHAHIPGAFSLPIFTDEQRKIIGTAYKQESRQIAVNNGLNYFSERMKIIPDEATNIWNKWQNLNNASSLSSSSGTSHSFLIHCWRGGMRSEAVAWLLSLYGYKIYLLKGGYKVYRNWVLAQFEKTYSFKILGGYTGSGKTDVLNEMLRNGKAVIDLEGLANHKGSAFGGIGEKKQPSQEMFENLLARALWKNQTGQPDIWLEDESRHIGTMNIPKTMWEQMRLSQLYFLEIPFEERLNYIVTGYGVHDKEALAAAICRIQKKLGGLETKNALQFLSEDNLKECFSILLKHYDKLYLKSLNNRENLNEILNKMPCKSVDINNGNLFN